MKIQKLILAAILVSFILGCSVGYYAGAIRGQNMVLKAGGE